MANWWQVQRLKRGVRGWNRWREKYPHVKPDLQGADLNSLDLDGADLRCADLSYANLSGAFLNDANLHSADLRCSRLVYTKLSDADLSDALFFQTTLTNVDLRTTKGLLAIRHSGPSILHLPTIQLPDGSALHFLRETGTPDEYIDLWRTTMMRLIQYHSVFISYSSKDEALARRLYTDLQTNGVRCWFAPEDLKIGDKIRPRIDEAIQMQDRSLLLLSEHSIESLWVENEVEVALEKEDRQRREVLFPIRLDGTMMQTTQAWVAHEF